MPTLALVNAISFHQMENPDKQFPAVRLWGTIGWIVAGLYVGYYETTAIPVKLAAAASLVMGVYSFFLPHTPPKSLGKKVTVRDVLGLDAIGLLKDRSFAVFVASSFLVCIPLAFYYAFTNPFLVESGIKQAASRMTMGQMSEVVFMFVMPFFFARLGVKRMLLVGMLAWAARYVFFAYGNSGALIWMFYVGILLHGICYDFFFVTGQIYVDQCAPRHIRANAQGLIALVTYGAGMVVGSLLAGRIVDHFAVQEAGKVMHEWRNIWLIPGAMAAVVLILFAIFFNGKKGTVNAGASAGLAATDGAK
jgi:nucleoside transporter